MCVSFGHNFSGLKIFSEFVVNFGGVNDSHVSEGKVARSAFYGALPVAADVTTRHLNDIPDLNY